MGVPPHFRGCAASLLGLSLSFGLAIDGAIANSNPSQGCCIGSHHDSSTTPGTQHKQKKPESAASPPRPEPGDESPPDISNTDRPDDEPSTVPSTPVLDGESDENDVQGTETGALDTVDPDDTRDTTIPDGRRKLIPLDDDVDHPTDTAFPGINQPDSEEPQIIDDSTDALPDPPSSDDKKPFKINFKTAAS